MNRDLELSPKFARFLAQAGLLTPVVNAFEQYRNQQNYPFTLKDKRIFRASVLKALCQRSELKMNDIEMYADKWTDEMYELYPDKKPIDKKIIKILKDNKIPEEHAEEINHMFGMLDKDSFNVWIKNFTKRTNKKKIVETLDPKKLKKMTDEEETKELNQKLNEIADESIKKTNKPKVASKK